MNEFEAQICGKISALEFVVEVMLANELARLPLAVSQAFRADILRRPGYVKGDDWDQGVRDSVALHTMDSLENLIEKIADREMRIRAQLE